FTFPSIRTDRIRVLTHLQNAIDVPQDTPVGQITLIDDQNRRTTVTLRAGIDTAEWAYDRSDVIVKVKHRKPAEVAYSWPAPGAPTNLYYAEFVLDRAVTVQRAEISATSSNAEIRFFGVSLIEFLTWRLQPLTRNNIDRFKIPYRDPQVVIRENTRPLPRAYLVPNVEVIKNPNKILNEMAVEPFDASKTVIVEESDQAIEEFIAKKQASPSSASLGEATITKYQPQDVRIAIKANAEGFLVLSDTNYPGWHALVDGIETKIYQANYLFRAIKIPQGTHEVEFFYAPQTFQTGLLVTLTATSIVLAAWVGLRLAWLVMLAGSAANLAHRVGARSRALVKLRMRAMFPPKRTAHDNVAISSEQLSGSGQPQQNSVSNTVGASFRGRTPLQ
ncbi:MAG: YfhO family protein, partial [Dehalococcoidia bacterium]|nr:YfhO family protein [Dehalococcoidia bacterium]